MFAIKINGMLLSKSHDYFSSLLLLMSFTSATNVDADTSSIIGAVLLRLSLSLKAYCLLPFE